MNKALVLKAGPRSAGGGQCQLRQKHEYSWGLSDEWAGVRDQTPYHSHSGGCQGEAEQSPGPYLSSPLCSQTLFGVDTISTGESISQHCSS